MVQKGGVWVGLRFGFRLKLSAISEDLGGSVA